MQNGLSDSGLCVWHDPKRRAEAAAMRKRGGRATANRSTVGPDDLPGGPPESFDDIVRWASWATWAVSQGLIDVRTSREVSTMLTTLRYALEKRDVETELKELRKEYEKLKRKRSR